MVSSFASLRSSHGFVMAIIGRCPCPPRFYPLWSAVSMAIASFYRLLCRACGDGLWSCFLPYRVLFPVVIAGFVVHLIPHAIGLLGVRGDSQLILSDA